MASRPKSYWERFKEGFNDLTTWKGYWKSVGNDIRPGEWLTGNKSTFDKATWLLQAPFRAAWGITKIVARTAVGAVSAAVKGVGYLVKEGFFGGFRDIYNGNFLKGLGKLFGLAMAVTAVVMSAGAAIPVLTGILTAVVPGVATATSAIAGVAAAVPAAAATVGSGLAAGLGATVGAVQAAGIGVVLAGGVAASAGLSAIGARNATGRYFTNVGNNSERVGTIGDRRNLEQAEQSLQAVGFRNSEERRQHVNEAQRRHFERTARESQRQHSNPLADRRQDNAMTHMHQASNQPKAYASAIVRDQEINEEFKKRFPQFKPNANNKIIIRGKSKEADEAVRFLIRKGVPMTLEAKSWEDAAQFLKETPSDISKAFNIIINGKQLNQREIEALEVRANFERTQSEEFRGRGPNLGAGVPQSRYEQPPRDEGGRGRGGPGRPGRG